MNIEVIEQGDVRVLRCDGSLDADTVAAFKKVAYEMVNQGCARFVVDFGALGFIDSMGLGVLISLLRRVRQRGGDVKVAALTDEVKTIFEITRLHRLFDVCTDEESAMRRFNEKKSVKK